MRDDDKRHLYRRITEFDPTGIAFEKRGANKQRLRICKSNGGAEMPEQSQQDTQNIVQATILKMLGASKEAELTVLSGKVDALTAKIEKALEPKPVAKETDTVDVKAEIQKAIDAATAPLLSKIETLEKATEKPETEQPDPVDAIQKQIDTLTEGIATLQKSLKAVAEARGAGNGGENIPTKSTEIDTSGMTPMMKAIATDPIFGFGDEGAQ